MITRPELWEIQYKDKKHGEADKNRNARAFYDKYFSEAVTSYGAEGDCWVTPIGLLEQIRTTKIAKRMCLPRDFHEHTTGDKLKPFKLKLISEVSRLIDNKLNGALLFDGQPIDQQYHSLINFGCIPGCMNRWRGIRLGDFPDLFLEAIRQWFGLEPANGLGQIGEVEHRFFDTHAAFLTGVSLGRGEVGWQSFADYMKLTGSFVNDDYTVRKLFEHEIGKRFPNIIPKELIQPESPLSFSELANELAHNQRIKDAIIEIYAVWNNREKVLKDDNMPS